MASPFERIFSANLIERKRKRSDLLQALEIVKNVSLSDLSELCSALSKDDLLWLLQVKVPNALKLVDIVRSIPLAIPRATRKTLLLYYFNKFCKAPIEFDVEQCVNLLLFCTEPHQPDVTEVEILAPPTINCVNCKKILTAQNQLCTVTVFSASLVKTALKLSCRCQDCKLNFGYSMFGSVEKGFRFYDEERPYVEASDDVFLERSLSLFQIS